MHVAKWKKPAEKAGYCMIPTLWCSGKSQTADHKKDEREEEGRNKQAEGLLGAVKLFTIWDCRRQICVIVLLFSCWSFNCWWTHGIFPLWLLCPWDLTGKNTKVSYHFLFPRGSLLKSPGIKLESPALLEWILHRWAIRKPTSHTLVQNHRSYNVDFFQKWVKKMK